MKVPGVYIDTKDRNKVLLVGEYDESNDKYPYEVLSTTPIEAWRRSSFAPSSARSHQIIHLPGCQTLADVYQLYPEYFI